MDMPRPEIPGVMKQKVEQLHERHRGYSANSFQEALSTVLDLAEESIRTTKPQKKLPFQYRVEDRGSFSILHLIPEPATEWTKQGLEIGKVTIEFDCIHSALQEIRGVRNAHSTSGEAIDVVFEDDPGRTYNEIVDEVFAVLGELIQSEEDVIREIENQADQYASPENTGNDN